jgi:multidrug efflux system membrane fusion protein
LQVARLKVASVTSLLEKRVVSQAEVDLETAAAEEAEAALLIAKVEVQRAELILSWTRVVAPSNGRVSRIQTTEGGLAIADQTHLLTVVATEPMYVTFHVPEALLLQLRRDGLCEPGKLSVAVGFANDEGHPHAAELDLIDPEVDPRTGTARFRATIPNPKGFLLPGMSARVRISPSTT